MRLTDDELIALAVEVGLGLGIRPPQHLVYVDGGDTLRFVQPDDLTRYGKNILQFARAVETKTLAEKFLWHFGNEHTKYRFEDWRREVDAYETQLGYNDWVEHQIDMEDDG